MQKMDELELYHPNPEIWNPDNGLWIIEDQETREIFMRAYQDCLAFQENYSFLPENLVNNYQEYLSSEQWKITAIEAKVRVGFRCQLCNWKGNSKSLHVHHRTYERIGNEDIFDLIVLCEDCHALFHRKLIDEY